MRAEDELALLTSDERDDDRFYDLVEFAFDADTAQRAMYLRLLDRGHRRARETTR